MSVYSDLSDASTALIAAAEDFADACADFVSKSWVYDQSLRAANTARRIEGSHDAANPQRLLRATLLKAIFESAGTDAQNRAVAKALRLPMRGAEDVKNAEDVFPA